MNKKEKRKKKKESFAGIKESIEITAIDRPVQC